MKMLKDLVNRFILSNIKSSTRFGESSVITKNINVLSNNLGTLLKERRFLYFTKKGPIEVVFNFKHYFSALIIGLLFLFKTFQFVFFGASTFFSYLTYQNTEINKQTFTDSEIQTLKNLANESINLEYQSETSDIVADEEISFDENVKEEKDFILNIKGSFEKIKLSFQNFYSNFSYEVSHSDEVIFDQFAQLASPELIAMEHTLTTRKSALKKSFPQNKEAFSYSGLPVIPFIAPRTNKLKIINFTKKIDREILSLIDVFESLNLKPDNVDINIRNLLNTTTLSDEDNLIENTSFRFQMLEELKDAIIYLPLKPPMQYYYVSSPYGFRIHPKNKLRQMHHGIDMAGTWQEEVRAPADGFVSFSGRNGSFGKAIKIVHKHGVSTLYGHLHKLAVKKGQYVKEGQVIGKMGSTGRAVGAHLHYEIKVNNKSVNPYDFITKGRELLSSSIFKR